MGEEVMVVEDYMLQEIETCKYYLSKEEFEDAMLNLEQHKPKFINVGKPVEFVTIKRRVLDYACNFDEFGVAAAGTSCSTSAYKETPALSTNNRVSALHAISEYYDRRGLKRKLGFAGLCNDEDRPCLKRKIGFAGLGKDEDREQCWREKSVIEDCSNLDILADACCSVVAAAAKPLVLRLKLTSRTAQNPFEIAKVKSRKIVKVKKSGNTKKRSDTDNSNSYVPVVKKLPSEYLEKINKLNGRDIQLIEEKPLTDSDISPNLCRLLLNQKNFVDKPVFLRDDEEKKIAKKDEYLQVKLIEPMGCYEEIRLKKWKMNNNRYNTLLRPWKDVASRNGFRVNDVIQVWSFRFDDHKAADQLGVAIVRI